MGFSSMKECGTPDDKSNKFIPSMNSYYDVGKSNSFNIASQLDAGLMSADDFCKLNTIVIPPPFITITSNKCSTTIKGGIIGIVSGDSYIKVDSSVDIKQNEDGVTPAEYENVPLKIHGNTYGIRFSLDVDRLSAYLIRNGRLILKGTVGDEGEIGETGIAGDDYILSGPKGDDGLPGTTPPINTVIQNETIDVVNVGSTGITDIQPIINNDGTYDLVLTRQPIGDTNVATNRISVNGAETNWAVVVQGPGASRDPYYLDLGPIHTAIYNRATTYSELIKKGYEDAVKFWIKTMSDLFDSQKSALCCALDRCKSRIKNDSLRRHFELTSATAKPDYKTIIKTRRDNPEIMSSTGILKELYPDGDFCKEPVPQCQMSDGTVELLSTNVDCQSGVSVNGLLKVSSIEKDVSNPIKLSLDTGTITPQTVTKEQLLAGVQINYSCQATVLSLTSSGKCPTPIQIILPIIPKPPDPLCEFGDGLVIVDPPGDLPNFEIESWKFNETNYLGTGLGTREYGENDIPNPGMWKMINGRYGLRAEFTDSANCGGSNSSTQEGEAIGVINVTVPESIIIEWDGLGELQDSNYDKMEVRIDDVLVARANAQGGGKGCAMGPVVSFNNFPGGYPMTQGVHEVKVTVTTNDGLFHVGSFYEFRFSKANSNPGQCGPGVNFMGTIKYASLDPDLGPNFELSANVGVVTPGTLTRDQLLNGASIQFDCTASFIVVKSIGKCTTSDTIKIVDPPDAQSTSKLSGAIDVSDVGEFETRLVVDAKTNVGFPNNAAHIKLPKGSYKIRIASADSFIDNKYKIPMKILSTKGMTYRSMDFVDKGSFDDVDTLLSKYVNNTIIVDHDGDLLKAYLSGTVNESNSGAVIIGISPVKITLSSQKLIELSKRQLSGMVRVENIPIDIDLNDVNTGVQTTFEFNGTKLIPVKHI